MGEGRGGLLEASRQVIAYLPMEEYGSERRVDPGRKKGGRTSLKERRGRIPRVVKYRGGNGKRTRGKRVSLPAVVGGKEKETANCDIGLSLTLCCADEEGNHVKGEGDFKKPSVSRWKQDAGATRE